MIKLQGESMKAISEMTMDELKSKLDRVGSKQIAFATDNDIKSYPLLLEEFKKRCAANQEAICKIYKPNKEKN